MSESKSRAKSLLAQMTLREKVGQLAQRPFGFQAYARDEKGEIVLTEEFKEYVLRFGGLGMLYGFFRADPWTKRGYRTGGIRASEREKAYNILQKFVVENTRLATILTRGPVTLPASIWKAINSPIEMVWRKTR